MRVLGTAGHVDHGKTALIEAMTGIDADRLPEEKARGMTTDLGFAWYPDASGTPIGVVDVPGHERYLRNMVAGAWGLDLAILVVAADDGWMPQSSLHASILASLSAPAVVIAITKADLASPQRASQVADDARDRAATLFGFRPQAVIVSAKSGTGIQELKLAIDTILATLPEEPPGKAFLYVDRFFTPRGGGQVVTGTLRGGLLAVGDAVELLPGKTKLKIRGIETYHAGATTAVPTCRAALAMSGLKDELRRGDLIAIPGSEMLSGTEFLCRLGTLPGTSEPCPRDSRGRPVLRPGVELELALGSARRDAILWPLRADGFVRIVCDRDLACPAGFPFALLRRGGAELVGRGAVLAAGTTKVEDRRVLEAVLPAAATAAGSLEAAGWGSRNAAALRLSIAVYRKGWAKAPVGLTAKAARTAGFESAENTQAVVGSAKTEAVVKAAKPGAEPVATAATDAGTAERPFLFSPDSWQTLTQALCARASQPGLMLKADAEAAARLKGDALQAILARLEYEGILLREGSGWTVPGKSSSLSSEESEVLKRLKAAGKAGLEPGKSTAREDARLLKALCTAGEAVPLDGSIFFARSAWDEATQAILAGRKPGDRFSVPEAKEKSGLSRKYILPLLNRMESKGLVKRIGDERVVLRIDG
ncbi:MAG: SelB C-terminal domain-containing protein [Clostridia bacterium]|jgi:selenocysteine-specific elongation factor